MEFGVTIAVKPSAEVLNSISKLFVKESDLPDENVFCIQIIKGLQLCLPRLHEVTDFDAFINKLDTQHGFHLPVCYYSAIVKALSTSWVFQTCNNMFFY